MTARTTDGTVLSAETIAALLDPRGDEIVVDGLSHADLDAAFASVQSARGWKAPILSLIAAEDRERVAYAVEYFQGCKPTFRQSPLAGMLEVRSVGYVCD